MSTEGLRTDFCGVAHVQSDALSPLGRQLRQHVVLCTPDRKENHRSHNLLLGTHAKECRTIINRYAGTRDKTPGRTCCGFVVP